MKKLIAAALFLASSGALATCPDFLDHNLRKLHSQDTVNLCDIAEGKPLLIINTASHCGYTPQFSALQQLHERYQDRGLVVVGFASNDFRQEASEEEDAAAICYKNYGVTFPMVSPSNVRGANANPVFVELARQSAAPSWNFNKYLVDKEGSVITRFGSNVKPQSQQLVDALEQILPL